MHNDEEAAGTPAEDRPVPAPPEERPEGISPPTARRARPWLLDLIIAALVIVAATCFSTWYTLAHSDAPQLPHEFWIAPAVGLVALDAFLMPHDHALPGYRDFITKEVGHLEKPDPIPENPGWVPGPIQETHLYLIYATAFFFWVFGLSWSALAPFYGLLYGSMATLAYGIFRLGMPRGLALAGVLCFMLAPSQLVVLPHLRDYAKAPFILAVILLVGVLLKHSLGWKRVLLAAAALGAVIGVGLGVRQDVQICLVPAAAVLLFGLPGPLHRRLPLKLGALATMAVVFLLTAWPILTAMRAGGAYAAHNILGGMARQPTQTLGAVSDNYEWLYFFNDTFIDAVIKDYARRYENLDEPVQYLRPEYNQAGFRLIAQTFATFPGDVVLRSMVSSRRVIEEAPLEFGEPGFRSNPFIERVLWGTPLLIFLADWNLWLAVLALLLIAARSIRLGIAALLLVLFFTAYPMLQFHFRHYFHLGVISWWIPLFLLGQLWWGVDCLMRREKRARTRAWLRGPARDTWRPFARMAVVGGLLAAGLALPLWGARAWQQGSAGAWFEKLDALELEPLDTQLLESVDQGQRLLLFQPQNLFPDEYTPEESRWEQRSAYLVVELAPGYSAVPLRMHYEAVQRGSDYSHSPTLAGALEGADGAVKYYFPIYEAPQDARVGALVVDARRFSGVVLPEQFRHALLGLHRVARPEQLPFLYPAAVPAGSPGSARVHARWQPRPLPQPIRRAHSRHANLLENGHVQAWADGEPAPEQFRAPRGGSSIQPEYEHTARGRRAIRQAWHSTDGNTPIMQLFGFALHGLTPSVRYDLVVHARNTGDAPAAVSLWHVVDTPDGTPQITPLHVPLFEVPPSTTWLPHLGTFRAPAAEAGGYVLVTTSHTGPLLPGTAVYWDDWRVSPLKTY